MQITERLFKEAVPHLRIMGLGQVDEARRDKILTAIESFDFATLPYDDLFLVWNSIGSSAGVLAQHECLRFPTPSAAAPCCALASHAPTSICRT